MRKEKRKRTYALFFPLSFLVRSFARELAIWADPNSARLTLQPNLRTLLSAFHSLVRRLASQPPQKFTHSTRSRQRDLDEPRGGRLGQVSILGRHGARDAAHQIGDRGNLQYQQKTKN